MTTRPMREATSKADRNKPETSRPTSQLPHVALTDCLLVSSPAARKVTVLPLRTPS